MSEKFNIADRITAQAAERGDQIAILFPLKKTREKQRPYSSLNFSETEAMINAYARGFIDSGIKKGDRVCLFVKPRLEFMPITFALYKIGAVVVLIDPGMGREGLLSCVERISPRVLIGIPKAMFAAMLFRNRFRSVELKITVGGGSWLWGGLRLSEIKSEDEGPMKSVPTDRSDEASILFTSGSTGPAKGVRYTHGIFGAQTSHLQQMYGIEAGEIDLPCFPLFGLFSLAMGMTVVIPDMDPTKAAKANPELLIQAIQQHKVSNAFASPALWKPFAKWCLERKIKLPTLKRVLSAGAPIPTSLHADFQNILAEGVEIHTPYGATESLPVATIGSLEILEETGALTDVGMGTCVGRLAPEITVRIIRIDDNPIEEWSEELVLEDGEIGEICTKGPVVTTEYKEEPEKTRAAKIHDPDGGIWHRMGDLGRFDAENRLWFCGRKAHRVELSDGSVMFPVPCEAIFNRHPMVERSALVEVAAEPVIIIEKEKGCAISDTELRTELLKLGKRNHFTVRIEKLLFHKSFPVDVRHNAKIHRLQLRDWAMKKIN